MATAERPSVAEDGDRFLIRGHLRVGGDDVLVTIPLTMVQVEAMLTSLTVWVARQDGGTAVMKSVS